MTKDEIIDYVKSKIEPPFLFHHSEAISNKDIVGVVIVRKDHPDQAVAVCISGLEELQNDTEAKIKHLLDFRYEQLTSALNEHFGVEL
jgi:hypothetical protein